uniref:Uncharacterized protein n=1 Tax=Arundo donax TaxID=35708 RepID=A0A0A9E4H3_ARUDO
MRSRISEAESDPYNGSAPLGLGLALFSDSMRKGGREARRG